MRCWCAVVVLVASALLQVPFDAHGQIALAVESGRGPQFLFAGELRSARPVPVDVATVPVLRRRVALDLENVDRAAALAAISRASGLRLVYAKGVVPRAGSVRLKAQEITVAAALTEVLLDAGVDVVLTREGSLVLVGRTAVSAIVDSFPVSGRITDSRTGTGIGSVDVMVEGRSFRAVSDAEGRYRLANVPAGTHSLVVRRIGYQLTRRTIEVANGELVVDVALEISPLNLDQLVVTGTPGGANKRTLGNAVDQIAPAEVVELAPVKGLAQLINGRAPGVAVLPTSGAVGRGAKIRIRGASSITLFNADPLLYVDGVRVDNRAESRTGGGRLADFNPDDIESIEIVKGPAAAALYGTEASAGVIQVITKRGQAGSQPRFAATIRQGTNWIPNAEERWPVLYARDPATNEIVSANLAELEKARGTPLFQNGYQQGYSANLSGGTSTARYYVGGDLDWDNGVQPSNTLSRFGGRANLDLGLGSTADLGLNVGFTSTDLQRPRDGGEFWLQGAWGSALTVNSPFRGFQSPPDYHWAAQETGGETNRFTVGTRAEFRPFSWMTHRLTLGADLIDETYEDLTRNTRGHAYLGQFSQSFGSKYVIRERKLSTSLDYVATANAAISSALSSTTSAGLQYYQNRTSTTTASGSGFPDFSVTSLAAATLTSSTDTFLENATVGVYLQQQFGWQNRLFVTAALRADDNSAFGSDFDLVTYPKVSASWVVSEEPFWRIPFVNLFRLRAAYGQSGMQPAAFAAVQTYVSVVGQDGTSAIVPDASGNPNLGPERSAEVEVGFDASLFGDRVGLEVTGYSKRTTDAILGVPNTPSMGWTGTRLENLGTIDNRGVEAALRMQLVDGRRFGWEVTANLSRNHNKIVELLGDQTINSSTRHAVGYPIYSWFLRKIVQADMGDDGVVRNILCDGGEAAGRSAVPCDQAPFQFFGSGLPKWEGGFGTTLTLFRNLRLFAFMDFKTGHVAQEFTLRVACPVTRVCRELFYPKEYDPLYIASVQNPAGLQIGSNFYTQRSDYLSLRELTASLELPRGIVRAVGAGRATLNLSARNLHTWTKWPGLDPEGRSAADGSLTYPGTPPLTEFITTLNITF